MAPNPQTYYVQNYGITDENFCANPYANVSNPNFDDVMDYRQNIRNLEGTELLGTETGISETEIRENLEGWTPKEIDNYISELKKRGNAVVIGNINNPSYCAIAFYLEVE